MFNMFFWFFKQLYYCLKRIFKSGLLLLIVFFIAFLFIFVKPIFAVNITLQSNVPGNPNIYSVPSLDTLPAEYYNKLNNGFIINTWKNNNGVTQYTLHIAMNSNAYFYREERSSSIGMQGNFRDFYIPWDATSWGNGVDKIHGQVIATNTIYYGSTIYSNYNKTSVFFEYVSPYSQPFIENDSSTIVNFSFNNLQINAGNKAFTDYYELRFTYPDVNTSYTGSVEAYKYVDNGILYFSIPKSWFTNDIVVRSGSRISFDLIRYHREGNAVTSENYSLGSYILDLTSQAQDVINEDSNKQLLSDINKGQQETTNAINNLNNSQQETTNAVNDLNNTVSDSSVEDSSIFLPSLQVNDPTQAGINNIFDLLYNAFTSGDSSDIVLPFPFTNKSITIPGNLTYNVLHNNGGDILIRIIHIFWRYQIFSFIVYDIYQKMKSIQEGNIEDVQKDNIKGEML